jgi:cytochrome c-type biogenesis protein CcmH/NrfF
VLLAATSAAYAGYGAGDPRLSKLYSTFMAPCCYGGDLTVHDSAAASELRARIDAMVKAGQSDDQIKATLVAEYGERILSVPEGAKARWLFRIPWVIGLLALAAVLFFLRRMRHSAAALEDAPTIGHGAR